MDTLYEQGYQDGWTHIGLVPNPEFEAFYENLSAEGQLEHDRGWWDGYSGVPRREERKEEHVQ